LLIEVPGDTARLAELLQFIRDRPARDHDRPGVSPAGVVSNRAGNARQPRNDLVQSIFLPGGNGGEPLFDPARVLPLPLPPLRYGRQCDQGTSWPGAGLAGEAELVVARIGES
jgi:hypothetical protein